MWHRVFPLDAVMNLLVTEFGEVLARISDYVEDGLRVQGIRRDIDSIWGDVLYKLDEPSQSPWMVHYRLHPPKGG